MRAPRLPPDARENRVRRLAARQNLCLVKSWGPGVKYALTDAFGEPQCAFGFDEHGSPAASLDEIEAHLKGER
jgi:hypothetical protein